MKINYKNTPISLEIHGEGKPIILLHGFQEERKIWKEFIPLLKENHQVICPDMFGHGETPLLHEIQTMEEMAAAVKTIMEELNITSASFIGHSMGGYITMAFLEKYPDAVEKLLLLNSSPKADSEKRLKERDQVVKIVKKHKQIFVKSSIRNLFRSEEHTSELQSRFDLVCRLLLEKKKNKQTRIT